MGQSFLARRESTEINDQNIESLKERKKEQNRFRVRTNSEKQTENRANLCQMLSTEGNSSVVFGHFHFLFLTRVISEAVDCSHVPKSNLYIDCDCVGLGNAYRRPSDQRDVCTYKCLIPTGYWLRTDVLSAYKRLTGAWHWRIESNSNKKM